MRPCAGMDRQCLRWTGTFDVDMNILLMKVSTSLVIVVPVDNMSSPSGDDDDDGGGGRRMDANDKAG